MRTSILTVLMVLLSITTRTAEAGEKNPFSRFSPKWDAPAFKKAKPSYDRDISKTDLELTHMVNLLRMDPVLFCHTVLLPHAVKTGKRRQASATHHRIPVHPLQSRYILVQTISCNSDL